MNQHQLAIEHRKLTTVQQRGLHIRANALGRNFLDQLAIELQKAETKAVPDGMENYVETALTESPKGPVQELSEGLQAQSGDGDDAGGTVEDLNG